MQYPGKDVSPTIRNEFLLQYQNTVDTVVGSYVKNPSQTQDAKQQAWLGLIRAYEKFDDSRNVDFNTYAVIWIRQKVFRFLRRDRLIPLPDRIISAICQYRKLEGALRGAGKDYSPAAVTTLLQWKPKKIKEVMFALAPLQSLNVKSNADETSQTQTLDVSDKCPIAEEMSIQAEELTKLQNNLPNLPSRLQTILHLRWNENKTLEEIGQSLEKKLTKERVRQLIEEALKQLRKMQ